VKLNPPRRVRAVLYLVATFATPTVLWASTEGYIGSALTVLCGSYIAIVAGLAAANTGTTDQP
jgi:hypothetical protein